MVDTEVSTTFVGTLSAAGQSWPLTVNTSISEDAALALDFPPIPYDREHAALSHLWQNDRGVARNFEFDGRSDDGQHLHSRFLRFGSMGHRSDETGTFLTLGGEFARAEVEFSMTGDTQPFVYQVLRNCAGFHGMLETCPLGEVFMQGSQKDKDKPDRGLPGMLRVRGPQTVEDHAAWRKDAEALLTHVQRVMSFATARPIKLRVSEAGQGGVRTQTFYSQSRGGEVGQPVVHPLDQSQMFKTAVASYFNPPHALDGLYFPMEWFAMSASYTEMRLLHAMTALENLVEDNLSEGDALLLEPARFDFLAKAMRRAIDPLIDNDAETAFRQGLAAKMRDLNRRTLFEKAMILIDRWQVSLDGLDVADLKAAIAARNLIVHRGRYYYRPPNDPAERDLWDHILNVRELVARIIFTGLGFEGRYLCFIGGQHDRIWPPAKPVAAGT